MKLIPRSGLAFLLGASLALSLTACDYRYSPGLDNQRRDFSNAPGWRNEDINRDSINYKQRAPAPGGVGSAAAMANGTVDEQRASVPRRQGAASPSGQMAPVSEQSRPTESGE
ncbi:hypothetical protein GCM10023185_02210 [Hymenobacter saemangeumensis]|uniref:Lipoprotein n=1 Tax=Hymenobacter saemangeumensis TaxID=1084522 RepID=A0ABP8HY80_9BACT